MPYPFPDGPADSPIAYDPDTPWHPDDPYEPQQPGTGGGGECGPGFFAHDIDVSGNKLPSGQTECVDASEAQRRNDEWGKKNGKGPLSPNSGGTSQAPTGTGPSAPRGPAQYPFTPVPGFNAPEFDWNEEFRAPSYTEAEQDPGYQFRLSEGRRALEQSAAGRGTLRTGGTLKDILNYGQSAASQEYGNVFDRYARGYDTRFGTAKDKYNFKYQGAKDTYAPKLFEWQTKTAFGTNAAQRAYERAWDDYMRSTLSASDILNAGQRR